MKIDDFVLLDLEFSLLPCILVDIIVELDVLSKYNFSVNLKTAERFLEDRLVSERRSTKGNTERTVAEHFLDVNK